MTKLTKLVYKKTCLVRMLSLFIDWELIYSLSKYQSIICLIGVKKWFWPDSQESVVCLPHERLPDFEQYMYKYSFKPDVYWCHWNGSLQVAKALQHPAGVPTLSILLLLTQPCVANSPASLWFWEDPALCEWSSLLLPCPPVPWRDVCLRVHTAIPALTSYWLYTRA